MNSGDEHLVAVLRDTVPEPPRALDAAALRTARRRRATTRRVLAPALAAVAVLAVTLTVLVMVRPAGHDRPQQAHPNAAVSPHRAALLAVQRLLASAPTLPGAHPVDRPPVPALKQPLSTVASPNFIDRTRWWTAPGSVAEARKYLRGHLRADLTVSANGSARAPDEPTIYSLEFAATGPRWRRPAAYTDLQLQYTVVRHGTGVAVRADAQAVWLPRRGAADHIPPSVTFVDITVKRNTGEVRRTLGAASARALARLINGLPPVPAGSVADCPMDRGSADVLRFGDIRVTVQVGGCGFVTVTHHGAPQILDGGSKVDRAVLAAMGLPSDYGE